ncbi:uncharacterized protein LOC133920627 [Phragmites australis]|uniref:uncharacterized protein LOC133920627 n=1 Tax=Phragmites australis TaxID=29695 RepID=UPI002D77C2B5|nr:uncharacterized protein LOC133920627 [Phragmites australis]
MASTLLRTSTLRGSAFRRVLSAAAAAAPSGGEGLAARRAAPLRRLLHSGAPGDQPPTSLDEKLNALLEKIRATRATSLPNDDVVDIFLSSMRVRQEYFMKQLSRSWVTSFVLVYGGFVGYYISKSENGNDRAREGN